MTGQPNPIPEACRQALAEIEADPLGLSPSAEAHVRACLACAEARVAWLAQEEVAAAQAPPGYFEHLPARILSKLPTTRRLRRPHLAIWALAATLLAAVGVGGYLAGRANRAPLVEATLAQPVQETHETLPDTPFQEGDEDYAQLPNLSPEQTRMVIQRVSQEDSE